MAAAAGMKIPVSSPSIGREEEETVMKCLREGWVSGISPYVEQFEAEFARYCGRKYGVACNSGTTALHLALASIGVTTGDEVIIPTFTMIATPNSVAYTGAKAVIADSELETWNIDPSKIEPLITKKTKAIMPVHTYGHPADMDPINETARKHGIMVVEDAAEAHGAEYKGKRAGALGDLGCFSFYANKIITTGEGGMVVTDDPEIAERAKWLRAHAFGREGKHFYHEALGFGYRLSGLQAALGLGQLKKIDRFVNNRRANAKLYNSLLGELNGAVTLPPEASWAKNIYWMYSVLVEDSFKAQRADLMKHLADDGIESRTFFYPVHSQPVYKDEFSGHSYPNADLLSRKGINLPSGNTTTPEMVRAVCESISAYYRRSR